MDPAGNFSSALFLDLTTQLLKHAVGIFRLDGSLSLRLRLMMREESSAARGSILASLCVGSPINFIATRFDNPTMTTVVVVRPRSVAPAVGAGVRRIMMPLRRVAGPGRTLLMRIAMIARCVAALSRTPLMRISMIARYVAAPIRTPLMRIAIIAR